MEAGPFGWLASTTSLEGAHLYLVDLTARRSSHRVGNFDDRLWGLSVILVNTYSQLVIVLPLKGGRVRVPGASIDTACGLEVSRLGWLSTLNYHSV
jgi:hypothetical protein